MQTIIELLMTNTMLTSLNLSRDCDSYLNRIVRFDLKKNDKQSKDNEFGIEGITELIELLKSNTSLTKLDLSSVVNKRAEWEK